MDTLAQQAKKDDNVIGREIVKRVLDSLPGQDALTVSDLKLMAVALCLKSVAAFDGLETQQQRAKRLEYVNLSLRLLAWALKPKEGRTDRAAYAVTLNRVYEQTKEMTKLYKGKST